MRFLQGDAESLPLEEGSVMGPASRATREKKRSISEWANHIEVLALVEDTNDGEFYAAPPGGGSHIRPNAGPVTIGTFRYELSEQSHRGRLRLASARGLSHDRLARPRGGRPPLRDRCEVFGYEGLFCMDSSAIPTSLGANPSLTIAAVAERAVAQLIGRAADFGHRRSPRRRHPRGVSTV